MDQPQRALVFANGDLNPGPMVNRALEEAGSEALAIGADGGAGHLLALGLRPHAIIGDMDSVSEAVLARCQAAGAALVRHPPGKDESDLELALLHAAAQGAGWIRVIAAMGGRLDQTLANVLLLTLLALQGRDVRLVAGRQAAWILRAGTHALAGDIGDTLSLIPLDGDARGVVTDGLAYPLRQEALLFGPARGISNVFTHQGAQVKLDAGLLLAVHTLGRA
jgi:thiamine pyrophosphokinase